jgi:hypothetical protein
MTRIIADQSFVLVREYAEDFNYLRRGNSEDTRALLKSGVEALLNDISDWVKPKVQADGVTGYNVQVQASADERQLVIGYEAKVVRGVQTILVAPTLEIAV